MILKLFKNISTYFGLLLLAFILQSCASFPDLPKNVKPSSEIVGIYSNDCDSSNYSRNTKLWNLIDPETKFDFKKDSTQVINLTPDNRPKIEYIRVKQDSFFVAFHITQDNQLKAQLVQTNQILAEKTIKGEFENDQCYYTPRNFYIVPFFPIILLWNNEKERLYHIENYIVFEETFDRGGHLLIMAAGDARKNKWIFRRIQ